MKKLLALGMCLVCMMMFSISAAAAGTELTASAENLQVGDTVTLTVSVNGADAAKAVGIAVNYNSNKFEIVSGEWLLSGATMSAFDSSTAKAALMYTEATDMNGELFAVTLRAISPTKTAETVSVTVDLRDGAADVYKGSADKSIMIATVSTESTDNQSPAETVQPTASPAETTQPTASPAASGIQGTVNVPDVESLKTPETKPADGKSPAQTTTEQQSGEEEAAPEMVAPELPNEEPAVENSPVGFPWLIAVAAAVVVALAVILVVRKKKAQ